MINPRPKALIAIAVAISSSIIATPTLAERKLQTRSVAFWGSERVEPIRSEVTVRPTLDDNQQPIPHSFTTTYSDQTPEGYDVPFKGFTDVLSDVDGSVASVDLFETDEHGVAEKYTKILKVGDESVFRFTHNLEEDKLVIEVRSGMTDPDSVEAVRNHLGDNLPLEPLTNVASPEQLVGVLKGANQRAGNLGAGHHFDALATVKVESVEVNRRTFMRLITSGDQPPEPESLGQSIFVNDEALFAAATSAYAQVYVLDKALQQEALNKLLLYHKPVGYIVHVEDETQAYPVPAGYPKLEVHEAREEMIVFHGQKQNPADIAFVEDLINLRENVESTHPDPVITTIKKDKVKSYQHIIRSKQMALLEEFAAELAVQHDAEPSEEKLITLANYESIQQTLENAAPDAEGVFEFKSAHIRFASWLINPVWMQFQLERYFRFKPVLRDLLANEHFVQKFMPLVSAAAADTDNSDEKFARNIIATITRQLTSKLEALQAREARDSEIKHQLPRNLAADEITTRFTSKAEVLRKLTAVEQALTIDELDAEDDVYYRHEIIAGSMHRHIREARQRVEEEALEVLKGAEAILNIEISKGDDKTTRLERVCETLHDDSTTEYLLDDMQTRLWKKNTMPLNADKDTKLRILTIRLKHYVLNLDERAKKQQTRLLELIEDKLDINTSENVAATERGENVAEKLARVLEVKLKKSAHLDEKKDSLRGKVWALMSAIHEFYDDEDSIRNTINAIARQLNIQDYKHDAAVDDQINHIEEHLVRLEQKIYRLGQPKVRERVTAIDAELARQVRQLGPKPRYVLDRELARVRKALIAAESELKGIYQKQKDTFANVAPPVTEGGDDSTDGSILDSTREQDHLKIAAETKQAEIEILKEILKSAQDAVKNDDGPYQHTPKQAKILTDLRAYKQENPLRRQALEAALGLAESAELSGRPIPNLRTFDSDDEFAPLRLRTLAGDDLTLDQAVRIVKVFKKLKQTDPPVTVDDQPLNPLDEIQNLVDRVRAQIGQGAEEYDHEIQTMGKTAIHFVEHEPEDLKSFSEYLASHSASGNKIIHLLAEGLISKSELEHYMKAVKGVDGYQTMAEFEHFLEYKHGVDMPRLKAVLQRLSDKAVEEFMQRAFAPVTVTATGPMGMQESVIGMQEYSMSVIANYILDDIAFEHGRKTAAFLTNIQDTLASYANAAGLSESDLIKIIHSTLMQAHASAVEQQLNNYWLKPSAFLAQAVSWYYSSYKPLLVASTAWRATKLSLLNVAFLYLLDLTSRGDYLHRMPTPFQNWLEHYHADLDRTRQYAYHSSIDQTSEIGGLAMPAGRAASSVILLQTGSMLFTRQYNVNPRMYRSIFRLVPEIVKSMASRQGIQIPLLHRVTPEKVKTLASATAGLVLGPVSTVGAYTHGLVSGFSSAQTFGLALTSTLTFDFFMNDNKMLTQWLGGPLGRGLDQLNRWREVGEKDEDYVKRTAVATPQRFHETDEQYASRVKATNVMHGWTRQENYLQFRERLDRTMKLYEDGWEKYFRENVPKWSFSHAESIPYSYTFGVFYK
ncbi:hypothetical protein [Endozoicomonas sp. 4G]|uniref:hypothetical protein n=1 Tax=Endozoicomonas sp. 4G TaxID=2872754 RepID=UPI0020791230|nr:hypothetical protein [Endozoicomonas sp. 4G]